VASAATSSSSYGSADNNTTRRSMFCVLRALVPQVALW
jgi:hypothetical protein